MRKVMGGVEPVDGCYASCKDKDNNVLSGEDGLIVESCDVSLTECKAQYPATTASGCYCL